MRRTLATTAALALVWTGAATATAIPTTTDPADTETRGTAEPAPLDIADRVEQIPLFEHLEQLQTIAEENGGNRAAGTAGYDATLDYVEGLLTDAGYETWRQPFEFVYTEVLEDAFSQVTPEERDLEHGIFDGSPGTEGPLEADLVQPIQALGCTADAYDGVEVDGQVALVSRGECSFGEKSIAAGEAGASAVVIYNNAPGAIGGGTLGPNQPEFIPSVSVSQELGGELIADLEDGAVSVSLDLDILVEERTTENLFAETSTGDPDNTVVLGAHADGVQAGPGIHDNGSGTVNVLGTALALGDRPVENKVRFAWWGAEELGLIGADYYVNELPDAEREQIKAYINMDMVAPLDEQNTFGVLNPPEAGQMADVLTDSLESAENPWGPAQYAGNSDYQPFVDVGIPSTGLLAYYDDNYHTVDDDIENVSATTLLNGTRAGATLLEALASDISLAQPAPELSVTRAGGTDRYDTAALLSEGASDPSTVFLASGQNYPDAVAAASRAADLGHPVLLTRGEGLTKRTAAQIAALDPDSVVVLGGPTAIDDDVLAQVEALGVADVERLAGDTRYGTAGLVALTGDPEPDRLYVATGQSYQDVLTASALAGSQGDPVLLVQQNRIPRETATALAALDPGRIVVLGGTDAVSGTVEAALGEIAPTSRIEGGTRYETAAAVAGEFTDHGVVWLASGDDYPDALATAAISGQQPAPVLLTGQAELTSATRAAVADLAPHTVVVSGGVDAVDDAVITEVEELLGDEADVVTADELTTPDGGPLPTH